MHSYRARVGVGLLLLTSMGRSQQPVNRPPITMSALEAGFRNPPPEAKLRCYWWWLNGNTDQVTITRDLEQMKAKGIGGVILVDADGASQDGNATVPTGPKFGSPAWTALYLHALREADRLGLEVTLNILSGWNIGGPSVTPQDASKLITFDRLDVQGGHPQDLRIPLPPTTNNFYRDIAVLAYPLHHGSALAPQLPNSSKDLDSQDWLPQDRVYPPALLNRVAAADLGFNMDDASSMLNDGGHTTFQHDSTYADAAISDVRVLPLQANNLVHLDLPSGQWEILRVGYTDSGATVSTSSDTWNGLVIDYMSRKAFNDYWDTNVQPLLLAAKPYHSLKYLATDSWEVGGTNWTEGFREEFRSRRGYDPIPYLPIIVGRILGDRSTSTRFLTDLRRTVADLVVQNHDDLFAERAAQFGLGVEAETGGPHAAPLDGLETFRHSAMPQTEFWALNRHRRYDDQRFFVKEAASAADIYGQPYAADEGETSIGPQWSESPANDLKPTFDMAVTEGMNRLVWHEFTSSPASAGLPGQEYFAGTHLNPNTTWWPDSAAFFAYLNRTQFLMQHATPVDDVLYYYGDNVPNFARLKADDPAHVLPGYDYDVTDEDALLHTIRIEGAQLVGPSGVHWRVLALPKTRRVSLPVLHRVEQFLQAGGAVVSLPPLSTTGNTLPQAQHELQSIIVRIWSGCTSGEHPYATGRVFCTMDTHAALRQMKIVPDVAIDAGATLGADSRNDIDYIHRRNAASEIYFLRSGYDTPRTFTATFRATGAPQLWNMVTGERYALTPSAQSTNSTTLRLSLPPYGTAAIIFASGGAQHLQPEPRTVQTLRFTTRSGWTVNFQPNRGAPRHVFTPSTLTDWTTWGEGLAGFSGTATYRATFLAPPLAASDQLCLQFTSIREVADVSLNNAPPITVWAQPYRACLTRPPHPGVNSIEIRVTNLWFNRLAADALLPVAQRVAKTNIRLPPNERPLSSGIIGPIQWLVRR
ncbi:MAG: glycosyl hydrolase [Acidobacteriaceae bacterium]